MTHTVERIDHVEVYVREVEAAAAWYQKVLGLEEVFRCDPFPVMIGTRGSKIALFQAPRDGPDNSDDDTQPPIRWRRVAWLVTSDRFAAAQDHLRACGVAFDGPIDHDGIPSIYFQDPDGNPLEITCYPQPRSR